MQILDLSVEKREKLGSAPSRRYCRAGKIPCILYGRGQESVPLVLESREFERILGAHTAMVRLKLGGKKQTAVIREVTWDTFSEYVQHVDLLRVEMEDEIQIPVPIHFLGVPAGAAHGGVLHAVHKELPLLCRVDSIPTELTFDISALELGDRVVASDLDYPEHVRCALADTELIAHVKEPHVAELEPVAGEVPEGAEPEGEAPTEGEGAQPPAEEPSGE